MIVSDIKDISLASRGQMRLSWVGNNMPVLKIIRERFKKEKPLKGIIIGACLHITAETGNLLITLRDGGARVFACASNPLSTQDDAAAALVKNEGIPIFAIKGEDNKTYYKHMESVLKYKPNITMDDGADLANAIHKSFKVSKMQSFKVKNKEGDEWEFMGSSEETTTGVIRLKAMEKDGELKIPVIAVNDSQTKHLFDNRYGTGQSTLDGIIRATDVLLAGKTFTVCGYGWCGRGIASRARGMGANVIVCEVDPVKALEALMDGFRVMTIKAASLISDIIVTATGDKHVLSVDIISGMKDGVILANSGHFNVEIDYEGLKKNALKCTRVREYVEEFTLSNERRINIIGEGRLVNLVSATGHPAEVMDMSFANQAMAALWFVKNHGHLEAKVYTIPLQMDKEIARLKLEAMGVNIDKLTVDQEKYLESWKEGT